MNIQHIMFLLIGTVTVAVISLGAYAIKSFPSEQCRAIPSHAYNTMKVIDRQHSGATSQERAANLKTTNMVINTYPAITGCR